jgi:hypothetical protein
MKMGRTITVYGLIAGVTVALLMRVSMMLFPEGGTGGVIAGFTSMIVALSFVFVGVKRYRDVELGGVIRFWPAFGMGLGIAAIAGCCYVAAWEAYLYFTNYAFMDDYSRMMIDQARKAGKSTAELDSLAAQMNEYKALYANPVSRMLVTFSEISPVAVLMPLISAAVLRNSKVLPAKAG